MIRNCAAILAFCLAFPIPAAASVGPYTTDDATLSQAQRELYHNARNELSKWLRDWWTPDEVAPMLETLLAERPDFLPGYVEQARLLIIDGQASGGFRSKNEEALAILQDLQQKRPDYAKPYILGASVFMNLDDYDNAQRSLERAEQLGTQDPWLYLGWARLLSIKGDDIPAAEHGERALSLSGNDAAVVPHAISYIERHTPNLSYEDLIPRLVALVFARFQDPETRLRIAEALIFTNGGRGALVTIASDIIERQEGETPESPELKYQQANLMAHHAFDGAPGGVARYDPDLGSIAFEILEEVHNEDATRDRAFRLQFELAVGMRQKGKARDVMERAKRLGVTDIIIWERDAYANYNWMYFREAIELYERAGVTMSFTLAMAHGMIGETEKFGAFLREQLDRYPRSVKAHVNYAMHLLFTERDLDESIVHGKLALALADDPLARDNLALAYFLRAVERFESGDGKGARDDFHRARATGLSAEAVREFCAEGCEGAREMLAEFKASDLMMPL